jgi:hypothetical protein
MCVWKENNYNQNKHMSFISYLDSLVVNSKMHQLYGIHFLHQFIDPLHSLKSNLQPKTFPSNLLNNPYATKFENCII